MWEGFFELLGKKAVDAAESKVVGAAVTGGEKAAASHMPDVLKRMTSNEPTNYAQSPVKDKTESPAERTMNRISDMMTGGAEDHKEPANNVEPYFGGKPPVFDQPKSNPIVDRVMNLEAAKKQAGKPANDGVRQELIAHLEPVLNTISMNTLRTTEILKEIDIKVGKMLADGGVKKFEEAQESKRRNNENEEEEDTKDRPGRKILPQPTDADKDDLIGAVKKMAIGAGLMVAGKAGNMIFGDGHKDETTHGGYGDKPVVVGKDVGALSEKYESGGGGVGTISSGKNDPKGGVSYGKYQLASKTGSMTAFLNSSQGSAFKKDFQGLTPGTDAFNAKYREVSKTRGDEFGKAQHDFLGATHYSPAITEAKKKGFNVDNRAIQEAIWAMAMHMGPGGARKAIDMAAAKGVPNDVQAQLNAIYNARTALWEMKGAAGGQAVANRLVRERRDALNIENGQNTQMAGNMAGNSNNGQNGLSGHLNGSNNHGNPGLSGAQTSASRVNPSNVASGNKSGLGQQLTQNSAKDSAKSSAAPHVTVHAPQQTASVSPPKQPERGIPSARPDDQSIWDKYFNFA